MADGERVVGTGPHSADEWPYGCLVVEEPHEEALIVTGVYGTGKSSLAAEIADTLEAQGAPYAAVDLDWLGWFNTENEDAHYQVLLKNLASVVNNYRAAGVRLFVLAHAARDTAELDQLKATLAMPVKVVRLTVPLQEIERRLAADVTTGRREDLREAANQIATSHGMGIEDLSLDNQRPITEVAADVLAWLGWR